MAATYYPESMVNLVSNFVKERGQASLTIVHEQFPERTKKQVHDALCNARDRGLVKVIFRGRYRGVLRESVWAPGSIQRENPEPKAKPGPVASVWELGTPKISEWPPKFEGGRSFLLLGGMVVDEEAEAA